MTARTQPKSRQQKPGRSVGALIVDGLASYGLCIVLLLLLLLLTFLGTIEQTEMGLYDVQKKYFESLFLVHHVFGKVPVPLPGAFLVLLLLTVNLLLGGLVRIRKSSATVGVIIVHVGIVLMLLAGLVKMKMSDEGHLTLYEEGRAPRAMTRSDEFVSYHEWEIAIWDASTSEQVTEHLIPGEQFLDLRGARTRTFNSDALPFTLELSHGLRNCDVLPKGPMWTADHPVVEGYALKEKELAKESEQNVAGVYVTVRPREGGEQQAILWGFQRHPLPVAAGGKAWAIDLRKRRLGLPFTVSLDKFTRELYPRTNMPKVFKSDITLLEPGQPPRPIKIEMNAPLRYEGFTLFQASWGPGDARPGDPLFSTFAVVRNPSDHWPLYSCIIISIGMVWAFGQKLTKYIRGQAQRRAREEAQA